MWGPFTNLDMLARTWQVYEAPFDFHSVAANQSGPGTATFDIYLVFPETGDIDVEYDTDMVLRVRLGFYIVNSGTLSSSKLEFTDPGAGASSWTVLSAGAAAWGYISKTYTTVPTGYTVENLTLTVTAGTPPGGEAGVVSRTFGDRGPDSCLYYEW